MNDTKEKSYRRSLRLPNYDYSRSGSYFVTICIHNRECLLGSIENGTMILNQFGSIVRDIWQSLENKYSKINVDEFVVMPNHIHGILAIENPIGENCDRDSVGTIHDPIGTIQGDRVGTIQGDRVGTIHELSLQKQRRQMLLPKAIGYFKMNASQKINTIRNTQGQSLWQKNYYEHIIRNERTLERIREYIVNNPRKWHEDIENQNATPSQEEIQFWQKLGRLE